MISRQASMPSLFGMITSMTMTSGPKPLDGPHRLIAVFSLSHHLQAARCFQHIPQAAPHDRVVVHHHHLYPIR